MDAGSWALEEFGAVSLRDARLRRRLLRVAERVADGPRGTVSNALPIAAERQGTYRLLSNPYVDPDKIAEASFAACVERCRGEPFVFVPEDGSSLHITDTLQERGTGPIGARKSRARGFQVMNAIAVSPAGVPLGLCGQAWWAREEEVDERPVKSRLTEEKETKYWIEVMSAVSASFAAAGSDAPLPWFQLDRGADCWPVLVQTRDRGTLVTVRLSSDRQLVDSGGTPQYLHATMEAQPPLGGYSLEVAGAGGRTGRTAKMVVRVARVTLLMTDSRSSRHHKCPVWCVWTVESGTTAPEEKPLNWMLLTTRPTNNFTDAKHVIFGYSMRWRVEEFHKA